MTAAGRTLLKVYLNGGIASSISILLTVASVIVLRRALSHAQRQSTLPFLVALSVGCLSGDAIFHLLPHVFLGETHSPKIEKNNTINDQFKSLNVHHSSVLWDALPIACTIYAFYLMHLLSETCLTTEHSHSLLPESATRTEIASDDYHSNESTEQDYKQYIQKKTEKDPDHYLAIVWMIFIGDAVHSFTDGIAIGGAYAKSFYGGLSTTIAIVCHEVPHCIGDFAVMVTTGLTYEKSLFLLTIAMVPMYLGMILGATLSQLMDLTRIIFAVSAAMFLFISLTELLPGILNKSSEGKKNWYLPVVHSFGILLGMSGMLGIAILEGKLSH